MTGKRVEFSDASVREQFFVAVKERLGVQTWKEFREKTGIGKSRLEYYRNGKFTIPQWRFEELLPLLSADKQTYFREKITVVDVNWGQILGGKKTVQLHSEQLEVGRQILLQKIKERSCAAEKQIDLSIPLSEELCEFIGAIIGDGCIDGHLDEKGRSKYHVCFTGHCMDDLDYLSNRLASIGKALFKANPKIYFRKTKKAAVLHFYSKFLFRLLVKRFGFSPGPKAYTARIPEEILNSEERFVFATIRGIFDTDGCVFFDRRNIYPAPYPRVCLEMKSKPLVKQIRSRLFRHFSMRVKENKRGSAILEIYGREQLLKWMGLIGFENQKHVNRLQEGLEARGEI